MFKVYLLPKKSIFAPSFSDGVSMKILFVINNFYIKGNGLSGSARRTVKELREAGQEVRVLSATNPDPNGPQPDYVLKKFDMPIFQPLLTPQGISMAKKDPKIIEEAVRWADLVHLEEAFTLQFKTLNIAKRLGKPVTATYHYHPENVFSTMKMGRWHLPNRCMLLVYRFCVYNRCEMIQCPTENVKERLLRYRINVPLRVISNGVIPDKCIRPETPPEDYYDENRPLKVICIGRLSDEKDQPTLFKSMKHSKFAKCIQLHFAGQGPTEKALKRRGKKLVDDGVLTYPPEFGFYSHDELRRLMASADLCVHCATTEVEGLSVMEALQQGAVPVIATAKYSATAQFALDDRSTFPGRNPKALAERIDYWLSHPEERWEMGKKYVESMKKYEISTSVQELIEMFEEVLREHETE